MSQQKQQITLKKENEPSTHLAQIRIELLKLVYRHDRAPKECNKKAAELEQYVITGITDSE